MVRFTRFLISINWDISLIYNHVTPSGFAFYLALLYNNFVLLDLQNTNYSLLITHY